MVNSLQNFLGNIADIGQGSALYRDRLANPLQAQELDSLNRARQARQNINQSALDLQRQELEDRRAERAIERQRLQKTQEFLGNLGLGVTPFNPQGGLSREQFLSGLKAGVNPSVLGSINQFLTPEREGMVEVYDPQLGGMTLVPQSQALGRLTSAPQQRERRIVSQDGIQYFADTGEPVIPNAVQRPKLPEGVDIPEGYIPEYGDSGELLGIKPLKGFKPKSKISSEMAGKIALADKFQKELPDIKEYLVDSINPLEFSTNRGNTGRAKRALREGIGAALYLKTGAAATPDEINEQMAIYMPNPLDSKPTREQKVRLLSEFLGNTAANVRGEESIAPSSNTFSTIEQAEKANLPKGTVITINGRKAIVE